MTSRRDTLRAPSAFPPPGALPVQGIIFMQRAAQLLKNKQISGEILTDADVARAFWRAAVGKVISAHTGHLNLVRTTLVVEVEDAIWQKQLHGLRGQILNQLCKLTGNDRIQDIEFRIAVPRRQSQRADARESSANPPSRLSGDESDSIQDPVLKKVYRLSRRKATG